MVTHGGGRRARRAVWAALGVGVVLTLSACDALPDLPQVSLPDVSLPQLSLPPVDVPTVTQTVTAPAEPAPTVTVTAAPGPVPTITVTQAPGPVPTVTVTQAPGAAPTVTVPAEAGPVVTPPVVTQTVTATPQPTASASPQVSPSASAVPPSATASAAPGDAAPTHRGWGVWPALIAVVLALTLAVVWGRTASRRRAWIHRLDELRGVVSWLEGTVVPQLVSDADPAHAQAQWTQARTHAVDTEHGLYALHGEASIPAHAALATQGLRALQAITAALDEECSVDAPTDADAVRARRAGLEAARTQVREWMVTTS